MAGLFTLRQHRDEAEGFAAGVKAVRETMRRTLPQHVLEAPEVQALMEALVDSIDVSRKTADEKQTEMERVASSYRRRNR
jgi:hypothetical protein